MFEAQTVCLSGFSTCSHRPQGGFRVCCAQQEEIPIRHTQDYLLSLGAAWAIKMLSMSMHPVYLMETYDLTGLFVAMT